MYWQFLDVWNICRLLLCGMFVSTARRKTIPTYEMIEAISFIGSGSEVLACLGIELANMKGKMDGYFLTVGERGVVRIWCLERYVSLHLLSL